MPDYSESFASIRPEAELIKPLIAYYYFHQIPDSDGCNQIIYYPNHQDGITFYKDATVTWNHRGRKIKASGQDSISCLYTSNPYRSRVVRMYGENSKIGIIFRPLGLSHFIQQPLGEVIHDIVTPFNLFGPSFQRLATTLYQMDCVEEKRNRLDHYFMQRFIGFEDEIFKQLIRHILETDPSMTTEEMAAFLNCSEKTVCRYFKKFITHTPTVFRKAVKFRRTLHQYKRSPLQSKPSLTEICTDGAYYDQSDFIKQYRSMVGLTPKQLYSRVQSFGHNGTFWSYHH